ncbi:MAG: segregation/condensation protein A [Deltaproteobacteria bacterium]|nr:segregation/condensation protein A [Deltaproteobacteria bacterium]
MYKVKLEIFEGPLDLLLHLIKKNEVDIYDIPIVKITEQYLEYMDIIKTLNLEVAGEFLLMAATLIHIKSKMLLPFSEEESDEEEAGGDPRQKLVRRLLEYQKYKEASVQLEQMRILGRDTFTKGQMPTEGLEEGGLVNLSLFDLLEALKDVLAKAPKTISFDVTIEHITIADRINFIMELLGKEKSITFFSIFPSGSSRAIIVTTFLAMLELTKMKMIRIYQSEQDGVIRLYAPEINGQESIDTQALEVGSQE